MVKSAEVLRSLLAFVVLCPPRAGAAQQVIAWTLSDRPLVSIGVVEGDPNYELADAGSSVRLDDGTVVVADAGTRELRFYDRSGRFLRKAGRRGSGPGEFQWLMRVYRQGRDSIMAFDGGVNRLSVFDTRGTFARTAAVDSVGGDRDFPMDVWLYRRYWVEGALEPSRRQAAKQTLDRLAAVGDDPWYRFARVDEQGNVGVREPTATGQPVVWTVVNREARPIAVVRTPPRFDVQQIGQDFVLGRWRDESDVNFIQLYRLNRAGDPARAPAWVTARRVGAESPERAATREAEAAFREIRSALRNLVTAQESYYADNSTYATDASRLAWSPPEDLRIDIVAAHGTGWAGVAAHRRLSVICGMAVGGATPPGWPEGTPKCG